MHELDSIGSISLAEPQLVVACNLENGPHKRRAGITGLPRGHSLHTPVDRQGRRIKIPEEGLIMSSKLAEILNVRPGSVLKMRPLIGQRRETDAVLAGTIDTYLGLSVYADMSYLSRLVGEEWAANLFLCARYQGSDKTAVIRELKERPGIVGIGERMHSLEQLNATFKETMLVSIGSMVFFAGLIAFGSILNAALVSLSEREREVGTLRVLGYAPRQVFGIFAGESFLLNLVGTVLGLFAGIGFTYLMAMAYSTELYRFPVVILPKTLFITVFFMAVFFTVAQLIVYRMIRRLKWLDVMKVKE
jgi:putative ABC transport system permease protein